MGDTLDKILWEEKGGLNSGGSCDLGEEWS